MHLSTKLFCPLNYNHLQNVKNGSLLCKSHAAVCLDAQERRKFLALPIDEKTTHAVRMMAKLKNELVGELEEEEEEERNEQMKDLKQIRSKTVLPKQTAGRHELKIKRGKSEILRMDKAIAKEERQLQQLEKTIERDNLNFEEFLRENEKMSVEARMLEIAKFEEILIDYKRYKELLFKLSPPEWQEAQKTKKTKVLSGKDAQHNQNLEPEEMADENSNAHRVVPSLLRHLFQDEPELYFTDPQQLLDLMTELTEQNLSLIQNSARVEEKLEELKQFMETTRRKMVAEVHRSCVDDRMTNLSTLEKLANIEYHMSLLLQGLESIPEEKLELMKKIKDSEKRTRYISVTHVVEERMNQVAN
uniref:DUF4200 domain-containing protein n=1 Tax=Amphiprion percula TaxID=161767 RepID=A0A3P8SF97_AMPPE